MGILLSNSENPTFPIFYLLKGDYMSLDNSLFYLLRGGAIDTELPVTLRFRPNVRGLNCGLGFRVEGLGL